MSKPESWKIWEGRSVAGKFPLRQWLGGSNHSAVFSTERPGAAKAAIKLIAAEPGATEQELLRIRAAIKLSHPHLIRIFEAGRGQIESDSFIYVVMELADEDLSQILPQRALSPDEVSDLLPPVLDAVSYLHGRGMVHSRIKPSNILAVGNQLKLSADQITPLAETGSARRRDVYDAPETAAGVLSPASDVWSLGVTLVAAITQNVALAEQAAPGKQTLPETIAEPYRSIARDCLQLDPKRRATLQQVQAKMQPGSVSVAPVSRHTPAPAKPAAVSPVAAPQAAATIARLNLKRTPIIALGGGVVAIIVIFALMHSRGNNALPSNPDTAAPAVVDNKPSAGPAGPSRQPNTTPAAPARNIPAASGQVTHRAMPDIPKSARNTIHGTIKVTVHVDVSPAGKVVAAKFKTTGSSQYFAQKAMKAAEQWQFAPQADSAAWLVSFYFRRSGVDASSQPVSR
jgi:serine/threonine protein kinase